MGSIWKTDVSIRRFQQLEKDTDTDVLVIGGGMAGVLTTFLLQKAGVDVLLCEAEVLANGTTKNTTAKLTSQHGLIYQKLIREFGEKKRDCTFGQTKKRFRNTGSFAQNWTAISKKGTIISIRLTAIKRSKRSFLRFVF